MKIHIYEVDRILIERYCRVIKLAEEGYTSELMAARSEIHNEIFDSVNVNRACETRDARMFSIALDRLVFELTGYTDIDFKVKKLIHPVKTLTDI